ncbi:MAG: DsbC family protein [Pseudomonadota bacterium]
MSLSRRYLLSAACLFLATTTNISIAEPANKADLVQVEKNLKTNIPALVVDQIKPAIIPGLIDIQTDSGERVLADPSGRFLIVGAQILEVKGPGQLVNLTEQEDGQRRQTVLKNVKASELVQYKPKTVKGKLFVFTDPDCGYCRKFHSEVPALVAAGVQVNYLAWPRSGVASPTGETMIKIWCSKDPQAIMDQAKSGNSISVSAVPEKKLAACAQTVEKQVRLGQQLGVRGTPAIFTEDGRQVGGYRSAAELIQELNVKPNPS